MAPEGMAPAPGRVVACGDGRMLELLEVQLEGRKRMRAEAFANGLRITNNDILGE
jgi:methionyl-tRNA formyltransferase